MSCGSTSSRSRSCRPPSLVTPLAGLAENVMQTVRADPGERVRRLKLIAGTTAAVVLIGWATGGMHAQIASDSTPPHDLAGVPVPASSSPLVIAIQLVEANLGALFSGWY
jgi:hypothetical protein